MYRCQNIAEFIETDESYRNTEGPTVATVRIGPSSEMEYDPVPAVQIGDNLSQSQKEKMEKLLRKNVDIFDHDNNHGLTSSIEHRVVTNQTEPINCPPRRLPAGLINLVNEAVDDLFQRGQIEQSYFPWAFPLVPVMKKDGNIRIAIDYRPLNKISSSDQYPTAYMGQCLDQISQNAKYFSTVDLAQGYHQVLLRKEYQKKTAFGSPKGLWQWLVMPEGLKSVPATLSRIMQRVFNHIARERIVLYFDDVCSISETFEEHLTNLQEMFDALRRHNLKIRASKCTFGASRITFLGHQVTSDGIRPPEDIATKLAHWTKLENVKKLHSFLSMCSWWRKFIKNYSTIAHQIQKLLQTGRFQWSYEAQIAFEKLKHATTYAPVHLIHPEHSKPFIVHSDASQVAVGGALLQRGPENVLRPVAHYSRALSKRERKLSTYDREAMAARDTVQHFRCYLLGKEFQMFKDHEALLRVNEMKDPHGRRARLLADLAEFDGMTIRSIKGAENSVADALSRIGFQVSQDRSETRVNTVHLNPGFDMKTAQRSDAEVAQVIAWMENSQKPEKIQKSMPYNVRTLWHKFDSLHMENGILVRTPPHSPVTQQIVPRVLKQSIIREMHEGKYSGHTGEHKPKSPSGSASIGLDCQEMTRYCLKCHKYQARRSPVPKLRAPLNPITVNSPGELVTVQSSRSY